MTDFTVNTSALSAITLSQEKLNDVLKYNGQAFRFIPENWKEAIRKHCEMEKHTGYFENFTGI